MTEWYLIKNADKVDSPALVIYPDRIQENINLAIDIAGGSERLRPHVKTCKIAEVCDLMIRSGINKFKCATIAEAEMLGMSKAEDVLLAYQPVGPKMQRFLSLIKSFPNTRFSCLADNKTSVLQLNDLCLSNQLHADIYIDLNVGMNRTGVHPDEAIALIKTILSCTQLTLKGIHAYDGHIHDQDPALRMEAGEKSFAIAERVLFETRKLTPKPLHIIMGGTPTFPIHVGRKDTEYSPGTFVFWDWGYHKMLADLPFQYAALVLCRVISVIDTNHVCLDLGHKAVAAENPLPRVYFLNAPDATPVSQSEEHLVVRVENSKQYPIGKLLYGVPVHICPTVALYDKAYTIINNEYTALWRVIARDRSINL
jgi:Predicted amino acid aldolase or racemase